MTKKEFLIIIGFVALFGIILALFTSKSPSPESFYNQRPIQWIIIKDGKTAIDVKEMTQDNVRMEYASEQLFSKTGEIYGFYYKGWYKGSYFEMAHKEHSVAKMKITSEM